MHPNIASLPVTFQFCFSRYLRDLTRSGAHIFPVNKLLFFIRGFRQSLSILGEINIKKYDMYCHIVMLFWCTLDRPDFSITNCAVISVNCIHFEEDLRCCNNDLSTSSVILTMLCLYYLHQSEQFS